MPNSSSSSSQRHHQSLIGYKLLYGYVKQYCETTESLPNEMQPYLSTVRSLDVETSEILDQLEQLQHELQNRQLNREGRESILNRVEELLYLGQLNGDRKIDALTALLDKAQTVNIPLDRFAAVIEPPETAPTIPSTGRGGGRRPTIAQHILHSSTTDRHSSPIITSAINVVVQEQQRGRLKRKPKPGDALIVEDAKQRRSSNRAVVKLSTVVRRGRQPAQPADEPVYCLCQQVSFGEMIGCDNDKCSIEWFHFECVSLKSKPKGKWYCPDCRGDRVNMLRTSK